MKNNIVLIGMPGAGKSTVGVVVAKILGYKFIDSDLLIQEREGRLLKDIIADEGVEEFIRIENDVNASIKAERAVIATGGSVVYGAEAMEHLRDIGTVVYLEENIDRLRERVTSIEGRGVAAKKGQTFSNIFEERTPLYRQYADITVSGNGNSIEDTIDKVIKQIKSRTD